MPSRDTVNRPEALYACPVCDYLRDAPTSDCEACGYDDERLLEVGAIAKDGDRLVAPQLACARCGAPSDLDDLPDRYFAFLAER